MKLNKNDNRFIARTITDIVENVSEHCGNEYPDVINTPEKKWDEIYATILKKIGKELVDDSKLHPNFH